VSLYDPGVGWREPPEPVEAGQSPLVGRLHPDRELARHAAFAIFVRVYLEQAGLLAPRLTRGRADHGAVPAAPAELPSLIGEIAGRNPHLVAYFTGRERRAALASLDPGAAAELAGWVRAQRVEREEPQVAYELGMLALGVELPAILVRALRQVELRADSLVAEVPDGSGYPTIFLSALQPHWQAAGHVRLFVEGVEAEQLAAWAMLLLTARLEPPAGGITRVTDQDHSALQDSAVEIAVVYNPVPWLADPRRVEREVRARRIVWL
jgi:hypothetical protein